MRLGHSVHLVRWLNHQQSSMYNATQMIPARFRELASARTRFQWWMESSSLIGPLPYLATVPRQSTPIRKPRGGVDLAGRLPELGGFSQREMDVACLPLEDGRIMPRAKLWAQESSVQSPTNGSIGMKHGKRLPWKPPRHGTELA
jgi:hypothetical protein